MYAVAGLNRRVARAVGMCASFVLVATWATGRANADIIQAVQISNYYGSTFDNTQSPVLSQGGSNETHYIGSYATGAVSELGINYTATADQNGFFFLHDNYCVGTCRTGSNTVIDFAVTNTGTSAVDVRFDSQITPGHLAKILNGGGSAGFNFGVYLNNFDGYTTLYNATGNVNSDGIFLNTGDLVFNGQNRQSGDGYDLLDWDTTNLSVDIGTLEAGSTAYVRYAVTYDSSANDSCTDILVCGGKQVVFGDPRNNGGVTNIGALADLGLASPNGRPVIGGNYGTVFVPFAFVDANSPFSFGDPQGHDPLVYDTLYKSRLAAVPEPATWAMMIGGFALAGRAMRRRQTLATV